MELHIDELFKSFRLNTAGLAKVQNTRVAFTNMVEFLNQMGLDSREYAVAKAKLQEACMFAIAAISLQPGNQE
jgi:hypothetical protein